MTPLVAALRPSQWSKNAFVLAPLIFAHRATDPASVGRSLLAFAAFCCAASASYLMNDLRDREEDRQHPGKRRRPLAAGTLGVGTAVAAAVALAGLAAALSLYLGARFALLVAAYLGLNALYSLWAKQLVILDVMTIAAGFVLRVVAGAAAIGAAVSNWLLLCTTFLALFLAFGKRRHELVLLAGAASEQRRVLSRYSPAFLDQMINVVTASSVIAYAFYAVAPDTVAKFGSENLLGTVPMVLFGIFRYLFLLHQPPSERSPTETILVDPPFLANAGLWGLAVLWVIYG